MCYATYIFVYQDTAIANTHLAKDMQMHRFLFGLFYQEAIMYILASVILHTFIIIILYL